VSVTASTLNAALAQTERFLLAAPVLEALLARREAHQEAPEDAETAELLMTELFTFQLQDGSFDGSLVRTMEALLLLGALQPTLTRDERCDNAVAWMLQQRDLPGQFAEGCNATTHQLRICSHFLAGFFSPGSPDTSLEGLVFSNGLRFQSDEDARLGCSARALRACLRWSGRISEHIGLIGGLEKIATMTFRPVYRDTLGSAACLEVIAALLILPHSEEHTPIVQSALSRLVALQRADGSWPELEVTHVAEVLLSSLTHDYSSPAIHAALKRAAELLVLTQRENGSWSTAPDPHRTYISWRVLRQVAEAEGAATHA
jgi:hypothetical protein